MGAPEQASRSRTEALRALAWRLSTPWGLVAMFGVALLIRLLLAPYTGFWGDLAVYRSWVTRLHDVGLHDFYGSGPPAEYPPGYLYVLWLISHVSTTPGYLLLKLPSIVADLGIAWIAGTYAARLAPQQIKERWPVRTLVAAAVLFNPAVLALSAVWGQVDAVPAMFVLWSLLLLFASPPRLRYEIAAFLLFAVAVSIKPQSAFVVPVMLYALYRRYLYRRSLSEVIDGALRIGLIGAVSLGVWLVSGLPFGLGPVSLVRFNDDAANNHAVHERERLQPVGRRRILAQRLGRRPRRLLRRRLCASTSACCSSPSQPACVLWQIHAAIGRGAPEATALTIAAASVALLAFALLTRMHERYMFLALVVFAPVIFLRPLRIVYAALSALFLLDLWAPYAFYNTVWWHVQGFHYNPWFDWLLGGFVTDTWQKKVWSALVTAIALVVAWRGARWAGTFAPLQEALAAPAPATAAPAAPAPSVRAPAARITRSQPPPGVASRWGPLALLGLTCLFLLAILRGETAKAVNLNDSAFHLQMVRWAGGQIREGRVPLDGWYPYLTAGSSFFHHYQSLPHTLTAAIARFSGAGDQTTYLWILYLLLALWPICDLRLGAGCSAGDAGPPRPRRLSHRSSSAPRATATSTGATRGGATASTRSSGQCGCCRSPGARPGGR